MTPQEQDQLKEDLRANRAAHRDINERIRASADHGDTIQTRRRASLAERRNFERQQRSGEDGPQRKLIDAAMAVNLNNHDAIIDEEDANRAEYDGLHKERRDNEAAYHDLYEKLYHK